MHASVEVVEADLSRIDHQSAVLALTHAYALDDMGNGGPLPADVMARLIEGLKRHPTTMIFLAYAAGQPIGIATCFRGFSTFQARPLVNIHDLAVVPEHRGRGVGFALLSAVERRAGELGCCKITLEVQENNQHARRAYERVGFAQAVYGDTTGGSLFYTKAL